MHAYARGSGMAAVQSTIRTRRTARDQTESVTVDYMTPALERWRRWTDLPLVILAVGSLPLLLLDLRRHELTHADQIFIDVVNVVILVAFAVDYVVEFLLACHRRHYLRQEWISPLLVISQALALVPTLAGFGVLRVLRGARAISVIARVAALGGIAVARRPCHPSAPRREPRARPCRLHLDQFRSRIHACRRCRRSGSRPFVRGCAVVVGCDDHNGGLWGHRSDHVCGACRRCLHDGRRNQHASQ